MSLLVTVSSFAAPTLNILCFSARFHPPSPPPRRDIQFQAEPSRRPLRPYAQRDTPKGAFGDLYPQIVPSAPDSAAVKEKK